MTASSRAHTSWTADEVDRALRYHLSNTADRDRDRLRSQSFRGEGYARVSDLVPAELLDAVDREARGIMAEKGRRVEFLMLESSNTPRRLRTVGPTDIRASAVVIPALYESKALRAHLAMLADEPVLSCPWQDEEYIINQLEQPGDTHGWHWGDYPFALIWVLEAPPIEHGGLLQVVPHTNWDKRDPRVNEYLCERPIRSYYHSSGDIYFLKTDTSLHRNTPLSVETTRIILNFTFGGRKDADRDITHETMHAMYYNDKVPMTPTFDRR